MPNSRAWALCVIFVLALASCNRGGRKRIAVVPKGTSSIFWLAVEAGAMAAGDQYKVDILWNGPPMETEYDRQIQIVDSYIAQRVDGLAVAAGDRKALDHSINQAAALGIPVTVFDSGVDTTNYMTFIATDNYAAGKMAGEEMG
ncbi:MAG TPA: substrate-binding domain-containing protein, partial [Verrucomicrobiae bacterium]|nr:substrate-binding domain-containing protein [Verrucomicrobiae bacterium]